MRFQPHKHRNVSLTKGLTACFDRCEASINCKGLSYDMECETFEGDFPADLDERNNIWIRGTL